MGVRVAELEALNPRLVPLIALDRASFGGAVCAWGIAMFFCVYYATPSRRFWQVLFLSGAIGFGFAIGVHPAVGYDDAVHLAPAVLGAILYLAGLVATFRCMGAGNWRSSHAAFEPSCHRTSRASPIAT
jgi:hypothetical protein